MTSGLLGQFNVANWLAATTAALDLGAELQHVVDAAARTAAGARRMERVDRGQPFLVVVDFAHTPQALENALRTLRPHTEGALMVVFGHAGERDPANRPTMGQIAADHSDFFIVSMDDPIHEDPTEIAHQIAGGAIERGKVLGTDFSIDVDRASAIGTLLRRARPGDTVVLAGKGHERRMLIGNDRLPWNDRDEVERALKELGLRRCVTQLAFRVDTMRTQILKSFTNAPGACATLRALKAPKRGERGPLMAGLFFSRKSKNGADSSLASPAVSPDAQTVYEPLPAPAPWTNLPRLSRVSLISTACSGSIRARPTTSFATPTVRRPRS